MENQYVLRALAFHDRGYNCAQSVACAFLEVLPVDESTLFKVTEGFGRGIGRTEGTCGAISGAVAVASLLTSSGTVEHLTKKTTYELAGEIFDRFAQKNHSPICKDLQGLQNGTVLRSCPGCIEDAVLIVQELLGIS